jgi:hypothetical protein
MVGTFPPRERSRGKGKQTEVTAGILDLAHAALSGIDTRLLRCLMVRDSRYTDSYEETTMRIAAIRGLALLTLQGQAFAGESATSDLFLDLDQAARSSCGWGTVHNAASVTGTDLRIGSTSFERGIGTHAPARSLLSRRASGAGSHSAWVSAPT